ncbi:RDD family protein [Peribacillus saganii]|uniref:RDD family protein n=1 Tax=Peribacillus saganii TaxID=2303992 RepID=A0A372LSA3_9BACI|nr:RDD family protein [Peribacillus saganii]RFU71079.1 RDD family protein [Peribacillus saganii]
MENGISWENSPDERKEYAGFWIRFAANLIDAIVLGVPIFILSMIVLFIFEGVAMDPNYQPTDAELLAFAGGYFVFVIFAALIGFLYFAILHSSKWQATVGKKLLGLKVTDLKGNRISFWRALGRILAMSFLSGIFYIGYIMAAFTERKQSLHDMIAGTVVVKSSLLDSN